MGTLCLAAACGGSGGGDTPKDSGTTTDGGNNNVGGKTCANTPNACGFHATCTDSASGPTCACSAGFQGDGGTCIDLNECQADAGTYCDANATCSNTSGSYTCACKTGWQGSGKACTDVNECSQSPSVCGAGGNACSNTPGGYNCTCKTGYAFTGGTCADVDECAMGTYTCSANQHCVNSVGSYSCACNTGFQLQGSVCVDIDECASGSTNNCDTNATCSNTSGSYVCSCNAGYTGTGSGAGSCTDFDECANSASNCSANATCTNTGGSFTCACNSGFTGDGVSCQSTWLKVASSSGNGGPTGNLGSVATVCGLHSDHSLWCWGYNGAGEVGDNTTVQRNEPVRVGTDTDWSTLSVGYQHVCAVKSGHTLWCWGNNGNYQLGDGTNTTVHVPKQIGTDTDWSQVSAGINHTCAIKSTGALYCWGYDASGQVAQTPPTAAPSNTVTTPTLVTASSGPGTWSAVSAGNAYTCGIQTDSTLWCWGTGANYRLGNNNTASIQSAPVLVSTAATQWLSVATGQATTCGVHSDGSLYCWGNNSPVFQAGVTTTPAVSTKTPARVGTGNDWVSTALGWESSCGLHSNGTISCWGDNTFGELGNGTTASSSNAAIVTQMGSATTWNALTAGPMHACAINTSGYVECWGDNSYGALGDHSNLSTVPVKTSFAGTAATATLATGYNAAYFLDSSSLLQEFGRNANGQLGTNNQLELFAPTPLGSSTWLSVAGGSNHACGVEADNSLWCWGNNSNGQLGTTNPDGGAVLTGNTLVPTRADAGTQLFSGVAAGANFTCGIETDKSLACWGINTNSQLGLSDAGTFWTPTQLSYPAGLQWNAVAGGVNHACGITTDGTVYCWGANNVYQGGVDDTVTRQYPVAVDAVFAPGPYASITAGNNHNCGISTAGKLACWGYNNLNQVFSGPSNVQYAKPVGDTNQTWQSVGAGQYHTCAVTTSGQLWCWGDNTFGQLGSGTQTPHWDKNMARVGTASDWVKVVAGTWHTCASKTDGSIWCWGLGSNGQLGFGATGVMRTTESRILN